MADKNRPKDLKTLIVRLPNEEYCYLTTMGRVTGKPHQIEIWFGLNGNSLYILSGGMDKSDWIKNLLKNPSVSVRIAKHNFHVMARVVTDEKEEMMARNLLGDKYKERESDGSLSEWVRTVLPVAMDIIQGE